MLSIGTFFIFPIYFGVCLLNEAKISSSVLQVWQLDLALSHLKTMMSQNWIQSHQICTTSTRLMSMVPKTAGLVSPGGMQTPFPLGTKSVARSGWVSCLTTKTCYTSSSILVFVLASTWNEPSHPLEGTCLHLLVWPSPQLSLATGSRFVSP
jgi:hypothetical protein